MDNRVDSGGEPEGMTALEIASVGQRLGAWLVDAVVGILVAAVGFVVGLVLGVGFITLLVVIGYVVIYLWMVATKGQSPGKMAVKIKIVRMDGSFLGIRGCFDSRDHRQVRIGLGDLSWLHLDPVR